MQLIKAIIHQARRCELDPAVAFAGGVATFRALMGQTAAAIEALAASGVTAGQFVVLDVRQPVHHLALIYALALMGVRSASVGATFTAELTGPVPDLFLTDRDDAVASKMATRKIDGRWFAFEQGKPIDYAALMAMPGLPNADDVFRYVYSSGTTGRPKCVALTCQSMELRLAHFLFTIGQRSSSGTPINLMGFSTAPGIMAPLFAHSRGSMLCFPSSSAETLEMIRLFNVGAINGAAMQIQGLLNALGNASPPSSLRSVGINAAKVPAALLAATRQRLSSHVFSAYGSTELGVLTFATDADLERTDGGCGYLLPWARMEIVDEEGTPLPTGQNGIVRAMSDELGFYVDETGKPAEMLEDGWFYPGDYGRIEADGLVVITGRTSEIINRGGVIVAPDFIEEVLRLDPMVADVSVVGVPTESGIDQIWAAVVAPAALDLDAVMAAAKAKLNERAPDRLFQVEALPRAESGKVRRNALRDELLARARA
jgi:acyl-coenzyme A synthetase/AMP-(fatty) acid ligase